jgi:hypothetical protein
MNFYVYAMHDQALASADNTNVKACTNALIQYHQLLSLLLMSNTQQGLSACQVFQARAALAAFDADFLASGEMSEYIGSLSAAAALLDSGRALPPPGEHEGNGV